MPPAIIWPPQAAFVDGKIDTTAYPTGVPCFSSDIPLSLKKYVFTEEWQGPFDYPAAALNTPHWSKSQVPDYSDYLLVAEGQRSNLGGGQVRWTRTYAKIPDSFSLWQEEPCNFIGFYGSWGQNVLIPQGRPRFPIPVSTRIQFDYFLIDPVSGDNITIFKSPGKIPVIQEQKYRVVSPYGTSWWSDNDFLADAPPFTQATTPNRTTYNSWQSNAAKYGWDSGIVVYSWGTDGINLTFSTTGTGANPGQICSKDSQIDLWLGNIWVRRSFFVLAQ